MLVELVVDGVGIIRSLKSYAENAGNGIALMPTSVSHVVDPSLVASPLTYIFPGFCIPCSGYALLLSLLLRGKLSKHDSRLEMDGISPSASVESERSAQVW